MGERCLFCDKPATRLCDRAIAMVADPDPIKVKGRAPYRVATMDAMLSTDYRCSAPCCSDHCRVAGFICGKDGDTIDHCIGCYGIDRGPVGLANPDEIEARRRYMHAAYRRTRIEAVPHA